LVVIFGRGKGGWGKAVEVSERSAILPIIRGLEGKCIR
jgi:hypothetical protein